MIMKRTLCHAFFSLLLCFLMMNLTGCAGTKTLCDIDPEKGEKIEIFDATSGKEVTVTDKEDIACVISNLNEVKWKQWGLSDGNGDTPGNESAYEVIIYAEGEEPFCFGLELDFERIIDKISYDGKEWVEAKGHFDYDFIISLIENET